MAPGGNLELGMAVERLSAGDRLFLEGIRREARLVDDRTHRMLAEWALREGANAAHAGPSPPAPLPSSLAEVVPPPDPRPFLASDLPMTASIKEIASAYKKIMSGRDASRDEGEAACVFHDLANYRVGPGLSRDAFREELARRFFEHPLTAAAAAGAIGGGSDVSGVHAWLEDNCAPVPVPSRFDPMGRARVLIEWMAELGGGRYEIDAPKGGPVRIARRG